MGRGMPGILGWYKEDKEGGSGTNGGMSRGMRMRRG